MNAESTPNAPARWRRRGLMSLLAILLVLLVLLAFNRRILAWVPNYLAARCFSVDHVEQASTWLSLAEQLGGDNPTSTLYRSRMARKTGDLQQARELLDSAKALGLADSRVAREEVLLRAQAGDVQSVQHLLPGLLADAGSDGPEVCEAFVRGCLDTRTSIPYAIGILEGWQSDHPQDPRPHVMLAELSQEVMDVDNAVRELRRALDVAPWHGVAALRLGNLMLQRRELNEAVKFFAIAEQSSETRLDALIGRAICASRFGRLEESERILESVLEGEPEKTSAMVEMARLQLLREEYDVALAQVREVLRRSPRNLDARLIMASALRGSGNVEEANRQRALANDSRAALVRAKQLVRKLVRNSDDVNVRFEIGQIHMRHGDPRTALVWLKSVLAMDPLHRPARQAVAKLTQSQPISAPDEANGPSRVELP